MQSCKFLDFCENFQIQYFPKTTKTFKNIIGLDQQMLEYVQTRDAKKTKGQTRDARESEKF